MAAYNLLHFFPLLNGLFTQLSLAHFAEIFDFCSVGVALFTKVFKLNVNLEI